MVAGEKIRRNLQGKFVSAPPGQDVHLQAELESILRTFLLGGGDFEVYLVLLDRFFEGDNNKNRKLFKEKSALPDKILATPMSKCTL